MNVCSLDGLPKSINLATLLGIMLIEMLRDEKVCVFFNLQLARNTQLAGWSTLAPVLRFESNCFYYIYICFVHIDDFFTRRRLEEATAHGVAAPKE
jgi:hypothetical protein